MQIIYFLDMQYVPFLSDSLLYYVRQMSWLFVSFQLYYQCTLNIFLQINPI